LPDAGQDSARPGGEGPCPGPLSKTLGGVTATGPERYLSQPASAWYSRPGFSVSPATTRNAARPPRPARTKPAPPRSPVPLTTACRDRPLRRNRRRSPLAGRRQSLTQQAKGWVTRRVGADGETVASVASTLGVGWWSVMRAVAEVGTPLIVDPHRLADVPGLGVDEHACSGPTPTGTPSTPPAWSGYAPAVPPGCFEGVPGRSGAVYRGWLAQQPRTLREQIRIAAGHTPRLSQRATRPSARRGAGRQPQGPRHRGGKPSDTRAPSHPNPIWEGPRRPCLVPSDV
jgi:hypothetical protein